MPAQDLSMHFDLTVAEREVLGLLKDGATDQSIAVALELRLRTVQSRLQRLSVRSGLTGRSLVAWSVRHERCCLVTSS